MTKQSLHFALPFLLLAVLGNVSLLAQDAGAPFPVATASVEIISVPAKAMVHIDGEKKGLTPYTAKDLTIGEHSLKLHLQGYEDHIQSFTVIEGPNKSIGIALVKMTKAKIKSKPKGAALYIDDELLGTTPYSGPVPTGKHTISIRLLGHADWTQDVIIVENYSEQVSLLELYRINFLSDPTSAEIFMDNTYLGDTPFAGDYPAGKHLIKMQFEGYEAYEKQIKLKKDLELNVELKSTKQGSKFFRRTLFLAALAGGGYYYYINYVDTPADGGFPTPPSRP